MTEKKITITNRAGIHARPAALLVQTANQFEAQIFLEREAEKVNGKSIMGVMMLAAEVGARIQVRVVGEDEAEAAKKMVDMIESTYD